MIDNALQLAAHRGPAIGPWLDATLAGLARYAQRADESPQVPPR